MILSRRVKLGATYLDQLDSSIVIREVNIGTPTENVTTASLAGGAGSRILTSHWDTLDVDVRFAILLPKTQISERRAVWESVAAWAMGGENGWLRTSEISDRRMWVDKAEMEAPGDFREWTNDYGITFHAITVPYWQDETETTVTKSIPATTDYSFSVSVPGQAVTVADAEFTNTSGSTLTYFQIWTPDANIDIEGLSIANNAKITISHSNGRIRIFSGETNLLGYRTGVSGDDLYLKPGTQTVHVYAHKAGSLKLTVSGRYL